MRDLDSVCHPDAAREALDVLRAYGWEIVQTRADRAYTCRPDEAMQRAVTAALAWHERDAAHELEHARLREESSVRMGAIVSGRLR